MRKVTALIASAGAGRRMGMEGKKQYVTLRDKPVVAHTLYQFEECKEINSIILIVPQGEADACRSQIVDRFGFKKIKHIVEGGSERQDSIRNGLEYVTDEEFVLIHDGVRPFVNCEMIRDVLAAAYRNGAAIVGLPVKDTVKRVSISGFVESTVKRDDLWSVQTPQVFRTDWLKQAHKSAFERGFYVTDDSALVEWLGKDVAVVHGLSENIKITTKDDLEIAETILLNRLTPMENLSV